MRTLIAEISELAPMSGSLGHYIEATQAPSGRPDASERRTSRTLQPAQVLERRCLPIFGQAKNESTRRLRQGHCGSPGLATEKRTTAAARPGPGPLTPRSGPLRTTAFVQVQSSSANPTTPAKSSGVSVSNSRSSSLPGSPIAAQRTFRRLLAERSWGSDILPCAAKCPLHAA